MSCWVDRSGNGLHSFLDFMAFSRFLRWRRFLRFWRQFFISAPMPLCSSHTLTSAPKNTIYMQKNSQNIRMTRVARPP